MLNIEPLHLAEKNGEARANILYDAGPEFGGGFRRVAQRAMRVEVFAHPSETHRALGHDDFVGGIQIRTPRAEIGDPLHLHELRCEMQHHRRLDQAAMDAMPRFLVVKGALALPQGGPMNGRHKKPCLDPQLPSDDIDQRNLPAMRVGVRLITTLSQGQQPPTEGNAKPTPRD